MTIRLITGVPGSGKTYYAVNHLLEKYCNYNKHLDEYFLKDDYTIITNIDSLILPHISLDDALKKSKRSVHDFFQVPFQEKISQKHKKIIYLLDEAQRFFPYRNKINSETWFYFEYHRHLGHDIYIITQDKKLMASNIILLAENELRAVKRTFSILGEFRYLLKCDNEIIDRITLRSRKKIFNIYKSFDSQSVENIKNPFKKYIISFIVLSVLVYFWFFSSAFSGGSFQPIRIADAHGNYDQNQKKNSIENKIIENKNKLKLQPGEENQENDKKIIVTLNYYYKNDILYILDPLTKSFYTHLNFPRPLKITRSHDSRFIIATSQYSLSELPPKQNYAASPSGDESAPPDYTPTHNTAL